MDALIITMVIMFCGIFSVPLMCERYRIGILLLVVSISLSIWFLSSFLLSYEPQYTRYLTIYGVDGIKCVSYQKDDGNIEIVNLNKKFSRQIEDGMKVKLTRYKSGPYLGLYFDSFVASINNQYKLELVPALPGGNEDAEL